MNLQSLSSYALVIEISGETGIGIDEEKRAFAENFGYAVMQERRHIVIASVLMKEQMEGTLIRWIQNICNLQHAFMLQLNNYSSIPPHTIFWRIQDTTPLTRLTNSLKILDGFVQANDCPPLNIHYKPMLPLASGLPESIYPDAVNFYAQASFHAHFQVEKILLLKQNPGEETSVVNTFTLPPAS